MLSPNFGLFFFFFFLGAFRCLFLFAASYSLSAVFLLVFFLFFFGLCFVPPFFFPFFFFFLGGLTLLVFGIGRYFQTAWFSRNRSFPYFPSPVPLPCNYC